MMLHPMKYSLRILLTVANINLLAIGAAVALQHAAIDDHVSFYICDGFLTLLP
jgi:hypothetical protein